MGKTGAGYVGAALFVVAVINRVCGIEGISPHMAAGIALSLAGVALMVAGSGKDISLAGNHLNAWLSTLYSGVFALCFANFLWIWGVGIIGSAKAALYNNLPPVFAVAAGYLLLGESFGLLQLAGAAIIFGGLYLTRTRKNITEPRRSE
jgi:drug/metabolite transporter (DMT)-like permease